MVLTEMEWVQLLRGLNSREDRLKVTRNEAEETGTGNPEFWQDRIDAVRTARTKLHAMEAREEGTFHA